jgi:hypothetical protein
VGLDDVGSIATDLEARDHALDRSNFAFFVAELGDGSVDRRRDRHGRLVRHHLDEVLLLLDGVTNGNLPGDDLALGDAFADIGHLEFTNGHGGPSQIGISCGLGSGAKLADHQSKVLRTPATTRRTSGM